MASAAELAALARVDADRLEARSDGALQGGDDEEEEEEKIHGSEREVVGGRAGRLDERRAGVGDDSSCL